jgi:hypothetical protein
MREVAMSDPTKPRDTRDEETEGLVEAAREASEAWAKENPYGESITPSEGEGSNQPRNPAKPRPVGEVVIELDRVFWDNPPDKHLIVDEIIMNDRAEVERWAREEERARDWTETYTPVAKVIEAAQIVPGLDWRCQRDALVAWAKEREAAALLVDCPECGGGRLSFPSDNEPCPTCKGAGRIRREWKEGLRIAEWFLQNAPRGKGRSKKGVPSGRYLVVERLREELRARWSEKAREEEFDKKS